MSLELSDKSMTPLSSGDKLAFAMDGSACWIGPVGPVAPEKGERGSIIEEDGGMVYVYDPGRR